MNPWSPTNQVYHETVGSINLHFASNYLRSNILSSLNDLMSYRGVNTIFCIISYSSIWNKGPKTQGT